VIQRVFIDTDVILDVATGRQPFAEHSEMTLAIIENKTVIGVVSSNIVTNLYYVLRKLSSSDKAKTFIQEILKYLTVISVDHHAVLEALESEFNDFEDAVQYFSALANNCDCIVTRNSEDYAKAKIPIYSPKEFVALFQEI
jgi:predicted nucleic acid-binding protein